MKLFQKNDPVISVRMTTCSPRFQLRILWTGFSLTGKMAFRRAKCLAKVVHTMKCRQLSWSSLLLSGWSFYLPDSNFRFCGLGASWKEGDGRYIQFYIDNNKSLKKRTIFQKTSVYSVLLSPLCSCSEIFHLILKITLFIFIPLKKESHHRPS